MGRVIDDTFSGLSCPVRSFQIGRLDIGAADRPGPALLGIIMAMTRSGKFDYEAVADPGVPCGHFDPTPSTARGRTGAFDAFDFDEDRALDG